MKELTREEALDFLVAGMVDYNGSSFRCNMPEPKGWHYGVFGSQLKLHNNHLTEFITIQDWLDAKADKEKDMINFSKAPEGATHSYVGNDLIHKGYYKRDKACAYKWCDSLWMAYTNDMNWFEDKCKLIPTEQPYIPEIGEECEAIFHEPEGIWYKAIILSDLSGYVGRWLDGPKKGQLIDFSSSKFFRPIKTEREIEREELVKTLTVLVGDFTHNVYSERLKSGLNKQQCTLEDEDVCRYIVEVLNWRPTDAPTT